MGGPRSSKYRDSLSLDTPKTTVLPSLYTKDYLERM